MPFPAAVAICEDDLRFDQTFLKAFSGISVDLRVTPVHGGTLSTKTARLVTRQLDAMSDAGIPVATVVVHHDVDRSSLEHRVAEINDWFHAGGFGKRGLSLVVCSPEPCLERWLCICEGTHSRVRAPKPSAGCDPWKDIWHRGKGIPLDRVRRAAEKARITLRGQPDFDRFYADWMNAGLEKG
jgi:hypothetical protein